MKEPWRIELLGHLQARQGEQCITRFRTHKSAALLAYLAFYGQRAHGRETLIEMLWPQLDPDKGRPNLSVALSSLRHQLEPPGVPAGAVIKADHSVIQLNPAACIIDVAEWEARVQAARAQSGLEQVQALREAMDLYRGELLPGYYEEWVLAERERLAEGHLQAMRQLVKGLVSLRDFHQALALAQRSVQIHPLREELHRDLMVLYASLGQSEAALRQYRDLERILQQEMGQLPSAATRALLQNLERLAERPIETAFLLQPGEAAAQTLSSPPAPLAHAEEGMEASAPPSDAGATAHLPLQFTRFFGREPELERLQELLLPEAEAEYTEKRADDRAPATRLVTLTGPGGAGKTRLAIEAATRMAPRMRGAVWFVPLADLTDARFLLDAVLEAMHLSPVPGREALEQIAEKLSGQPALLVLDNFEQLAADGARIVRKLLEQAPSLRCLVTSRHLLNLEGEREFVVPPLPLPEGAAPPQDLVQCASVRLFVDRAQIVKPDFQVTPQNAAALAELCRRLEGLPLALELAAARAQVLTPTQMLAQLERRLDFLVSRRRDAMERHRTLRGAIEWSFRLLAPELQQFFARLSIFRGGWSLTAAEAVCEESLALDYLAQLRECSLVLIEDDSAGASEMRFRLLDMLRAYAVEQLSEEERTALACRHATYYREIAEVSEAALNGPQQGEWLARLAADHDNLRAAIDWLHAQGEEEPAARMCVGLGEFWEKRGWLREGRQRLMRCLERQQEVTDSGLIVRLLGALGWFAYLQSDYEEASAHHERSLLLCRRVGDREGEAVALNNLALVVQVQGRLSEARTLFEQSLEIARALEDGPLIAARLSNLGLLATQEGQYEEAHRCLTEAHATYQRCGALSGTIACLCNLGDLALRRQEWNEAELFLKAGLALSRQVEDRPGTAYILANLAEAAVARVDQATAEQYIREALSLCQELDLRSLVPSLLEIHAGIRHARGDSRKAAFSLACAESLRSDLHTPRSAEEEVRLNALEARLTEDIDRKEMDAIRTLATGLSLEQIVIEVMPGDAVAI